MAQWRMSAERLYARITRDARGCWLWTGRTDKDGYGTVSYRNRPWGAHRLSWFFTHGEIPADVFVCHECDVPACINPEHLFLGTALDNMKDRDAKGRHVPSPGSKHGIAKVVESDVVAMRLAFANGAHPRDLAAQYGLSHSNTDKIVRGRAWLHVPMPTVETV